MKIQEEGAISRVRCDKHEEEQLKIKKQVFSDIMLKIQKGTELSRLIKIKK